jgi:hypothetical protein
MDAAGFPVQRNKRYSDVSFQFPLMIMFVNFRFDAEDVRKAIQYICVGEYIYSKKFKPGSNRPSSLAALPAFHQLLTRGHPENNFGDMLLDPDGTWSLSERGGNSSRDRSCAFGLNRPCVSKQGVEML